MSPQPSPVRKFALEDMSETGSLTFGEASRLPLTIPKALIATIWGQVEEGVRILPRGGAEVGGLLVGPKSRENGVVVDAIIPLPIDYEHGPSFRMSAADLSKIAVLVETVQVDPSKAVVGFYRSQTRSHETFRDSDREIFDAIEQTHTSFAADFLCYFVLAPVSKLEMLTCISMWNGDDWDGMQFTLRSNPFSVVQAPSSVARRVSLPAEVQASRPPESSVVPAVPQTVPQVATERGPKPPELWLAAAWLRSNRLYVAAGVLALAVVVGGYRWIVKSRTAPAVSSQSQTGASTLHMGFSANREGPVWRLSWDRAAMEELKPSGALLAIHDGNREQQLSLTPADLSSGTIFYTPQAGDLVFSLQISRSGAAPIEEHIRVLEGPRGVQKSAERESPTPPSDAAVPEKASSRPAPVPANLPLAASSGSGKETPAIVRDVPPSPAETPQPPAVAFAVPVAPRLAPSIDREIPPPRATTPQPTPTPAEPAAPKSTPAPENVVPNAPSATTNTTASTVAAPVPPPSATVPSPANPNYIGPKPVRQVAPQPPANVKMSGVQIKIHVDIDTRGKVTSAAPVGVAATNFSLVFVAVRAARSWEFEPAKLAGKPVASEMDLIFRF